MRAVGRAGARRSALSQISILHPKAQSPMLMSWASIRCALKSSGQLTGGPEDDPSADEAYGCADQVPAVRAGTFHDPKPN